MLKWLLGQGGARIAWVLSFALVPQHSCVFHVSEVSTYCYDILRISRKKVSCCVKWNGFSLQHK